MKYSNESLICFIAKPTCTLLSCFNFLPKCTQHQQFLSHCSYRKVNICVDVAKLGYWPPTAGPSNKPLSCPGTRAYDHHHCCFCCYFHNHCCQFGPRSQPQLFLQGPVVPQTVSCVCMYARQPANGLLLTMFMGLNLSVCVYCCQTYLLCSHAYFTVPSDFMYKIQSQR